MVNWPNGWLHVPPIIAQNCLVLVPIEFCPVNVDWSEGGRREVSSSNYETMQGNLMWPFCRFPVNLSTSGLLGNYFPRSIQTDRDVVSDGLPRSHCI